MSATHPAGPTDLRTYERLLKEAAAIKGMSLGRDAWRRLRKNAVAMASLGFLVLLFVASILTPLFPLAPPRELQTTRRFEVPQVSPLFVQTLILPSAPTDAAGRALEDFDPFERDFGSQNAFNQVLLNARLAIFGKWTLNSVCGRDELGRDVLSRLFWGSRVSLEVALVATFVALLIGVTYGAVSGYLGGWVDNAMMRFVDILYSIPFIFVVIFLISILGENSVSVKLLGDRTVKGWLDDHGIDRITIFFFVVGGIYWLTMARVVRGQILSLKNDQFVEAARTIGASRPRIIFLHLVPNVLSVIIVYLTLTIPQVMLFEAFLSFLGLGVEPPDVSWGMMADEGVKVITPIKIYWWLVLFPSLALGTTLFALNFLGDGLRDALDPRFKNR